jgi:FkbM family methyltransferase
MNSSVPGKYFCQITSVLQRILVISVKVCSGHNRWIALKSRNEYWGLNKLDQKLATRIPIRNGFFVELGANDGINQSNTKYFELFRGWRGILIEPSPINYRKLKFNRSKRTKFIRAACVSKEDTRKEIEFEYLDLMTVSRQSDSDLLDLNSHLGHARKRVAKRHRDKFFTAPTVTLNSIFTENDAPSRMNLLSLDVEGAELAVLQGVDHEKFRFDFICIECRELTRMNEYLSSVGYELVEKLSEHDYLFIDARARSAK